jgi:hypothetical protein
MTSVFLRASSLAPFYLRGWRSCLTSTFICSLGSFDDFHYSSHCHATFSFGLFRQVEPVSLSRIRDSGTTATFRPGPPSCRAITRTFIVESAEERQTDCWHTVIWSCVARPPASPSAASATNATANALSATVTSAPQLSSASATNAPSETTKTNALSVVAR